MMFACTVAELASVAKLYVCPTLPQIYLKLLIQNTRTEYVDVVELAPALNFCGWGNLT